LLTLTAPSLFSAILLSHPYAGQMLDILDEGAGNASALVISPDGSRQSYALQDGHLSVLADPPGLWLVRINSEQASADVPPAPGSGRSAPAVPASPLPFFLLVLLCAALLLALALAATAAWSLAYPPACSRPPVLRRRAQGGEARAELEAGTLPLENAWLEDDGVPGAGRPLRISARRLSAGHCLQMRYPAQQLSGEARAHFTLEGKPQTLSVKQGEAGGAAAPISGAQAPGLLGQALPSESPTPPARKLTRGS
ncbi:MAG: hypothetical protein KGH63_04785, partial [Candidatus Micrarchaeota archaeon]|nr:hypothetical protein [Candidatus Micrarchaeota archaeon]